ncbi:hypothetical protein HOI83_01700 [Candidatus Uhrbacteria bacterium]|jgi:hypothetical protein|nr:hypothetical protein [Candidatus Uhrbacteria bacterium]
MKKQFKNLRRSSKPSIVFKKRLWLRIDAELPVPGRKSLVLRYTYVVGLASVVMMTTGMGTYAYAADGVTPDSSLYGVKTSIESVESRFHRSPESMASFHARMAGRRHRELDHVKSKLGREALEEKLAHILGVTAVDLEGVKEDVEKRETIELEMRRIHELRFKEQAETFYNELHNKVDQYEMRGELDAENAKELRDTFWDVKERKIYMMDHYEGEIDRRRLDSIHR